MEALLDQLSKNWELIASIALLPIFLVMKRQYTSFITRTNRKNIGEAFRQTVGGLSSKDIEVQMSSAVLLRRFFDSKSEYGVGRTPYARDTINVIAAILKSLPTGYLQKTLADGIRFAPNGYLQNADFQGSNLSSALLNKKEATDNHKNSNFEGTDFFQANLSQATLRNSTLIGAVFCEATLYETRFNNSQLQKSNFSGSSLHGTNFSDANLTGASFAGSVLRKVNFEGTNLTDANFKDATLIDVHFARTDLTNTNFENTTLNNMNLKDVALSNAKFTGTHFININFADADVTNVSFINTKHSDCKRPPKSIIDISHQPDESKPYTIFISRPGILDASQELFLTNIKDKIKMLKKFETKELGRDQYRHQEVLSDLVENIHGCSAMIVLGFKSTHVVSGTYRYCTPDAEPLNDRFLSTPWNHIEVGIAISQKMPTLMLIDEQINDGAFALDVNDKKLTKFRISECLDDDLENVTHWVQQQCPSDTASS